jgi:hypothetical protein
MDKRSSGNMQKESEGTWKIIARVLEKFRGKIEAGKSVSLLLLLSLLLLK